MRLKMPYMYNYLRDLTALKKQLAKPRKKNLGNPTSLHTQLGGRRHQFEAGSASIASPITALIFKYNPFVRTMLQMGFELVSINKTNKVEREHYE